MAVITLGEWAYAHSDRVQYTQVVDSAGEYLCSLSNHGKAVEYWGCQVVEFDSATVKIVAL